MSGLIQKCKDLIYKLGVPEKDWFDPKTLGLLGGGHKICQESTDANKGETNIKF